MTKVIIHSNSSLDSFYEQVIEDLHRRYHTYPSSLAGIEPTAQEKSDISFADGQARRIAARGVGRGFNPGKDVA